MHAAQYNRPGAWQSARKVIAYDYGIGWLSDAELRDADRRRIRDEREAEAAERLHRQLARAAA
jgi:anti-sigma-K factor RskA